MVHILNGSAVTLTNAVKIKLLSNIFYFMASLGQYVYPDLQSPTERVSVF